MRVNAMACRLLTLYFNFISKAHAMTHNYLFKNMILLISLLFLAPVAQAGDVLGVKPSYLNGVTPDVPNQVAISRIIWAPGLDDGFVPQGMTFSNGALFMSAYQSSFSKSTKGPCRIFKVDPNSGQTIGYFDLDLGCGHAGGLAATGKGHLIVADTHRLYKIDVASAFASGHPTNAVVAKLDLGGKLKGSFADFHAGSIFIGSYEKNVSHATGYYLPFTLFDTHNGQAITEQMASRSINLPPQSQGAAFDKNGVLWISSSTGKFGLLSRLDAKTGAVQARYDMVNGIEDLAFDDAGRLWSVSESGSIRWRNRSVSFPVLFRVEMGRLK
jgi:hypothetical protein